MLANAKIPNFESSEKYLLYHVLIKADFGFSNISKGIFCEKTEA
jgi:hypothetical protein